MPSPDPQPNLISEEQRPSLTDGTLFPIVLETDAATILNNLESSHVAEIEICPITAIEVNRLDCRSYFPALPII